MLLFLIEKWFLQRSLHKVYVLPLGKMMALDQPSLCTELYEHPHLNQLPSNL